MKKWFLAAALAVSAFVSTSAMALDRTVIAEKAEDVTPLLIGSTAPNVTVNLSLIHI